MVSTEAWSGTSIGVAPEVRLILATGGGKDLDPAIIALVSGPLNWEVFGALVGQERAAAVVWPRLRRLCQGRIPAQAQSALQRDAMLGDVRMARLSRRLDQTLDALTAAGIPVVLLKGAALGRTVYRSLPRRPMLDLDLLVPEKQLQEALAVVLATGWETGPRQSLAESYYQDHHHLPPFVDRAGGDFSLELHHGIFFRGHPFELDVQEWWDRARTLPDAPRVKVPDTTHMILHLAVHFAWSHMMRSAAWRTFRDLRVLVEDTAIDWDRIAGAAGRMGAGTCCYWTFRLARHWAGVPVPESVMQRLRPPLPEPALRVLERHFVQQCYPVWLACPSIRLDRALWRAAIRPRWSGHGSAVPWQRDDRFVLPQADPRPHEAALHKGLRHLAKLGAYIRYFWQILGRT